MRSTAIFIIQLTGIISLTIIPFCISAQNSVEQPYSFAYTRSGDCHPTQHVVFRTFITDSILVDSTVISYDTTTYAHVDTFMRGANEWLRLSNGEWQSYFSKTSFLANRKTYFGAKDVRTAMIIVTPLRVETVNGLLCYVFRVYRKDDGIAYAEERYFNFDLGIIKFTSSYRPCEVVSTLKKKN